MTDIMSSTKRSELMAKVRSKDTKPELTVRRLVHSMGYRFRLHVPNLAGKPDLVFAGRGKIIFMHGCFWHQHASCAKATIPATRQEFWKDKLAHNVSRDKKTIRKLQRDGWSVLTVWECDLKNIDRLRKKLERFLSN